MTDEFILNNILLTLEKFYYNSSEEELANTGYKFEDICLNVSLLYVIEISVDMQRKYENILLADGYIKYKKPKQLKVLQITPKGLKFIGDGGYKEEHNDENKNNVSGLKKDKKFNKEVPSTFEDMFIYPELIQDCIDVLKKLAPPVLNEADNYIGKYKGVFCVWVDVLNSKNLIKFYADRKIYAEKISQKFAPFSIDESMFGKTHRKAEEKYKDDLINLLSQVSQKVKLGK